MVPELLEVSDGLEFTFRSQLVFNTNNLKNTFCMCVALHQFLYSYTVNIIST